MTPLRSARRRFRVRRLQRRISCGLEPCGAFLPCRYPPAAEAVGAPELAPFLRAGEPSMVRILAAIDGHEPDFARFGGPPPAPRFEQDWFPGLDAAAAYALVRMARPRRIVEVGSGHSTRVLARAIADGGLTTDLVAIDPAPRAALDGLSVSWRRCVVQAADPAVVDDLGPGDVLVVDSSHLVFAGSDVAFVWLRLLPRLRAGVLLHVHDVFLPDPYPPAWAWRGYNEHVAVAPLVLGGWRVRWASHYLRTHRPDLLEGRLAARLPVPTGAAETSLWLERA